eukprot:jgi/Orpsp1_1/1179948/evm.model.c7180000071512.1
MKSENIYSEKELNINNDQNMGSMNEIGRVEIISPVNLYDEFNSSCNDIDIEEELEKLNIKEIFTINDETINNNSTRFNNQIFLKQFLNKDVFQIKDIKTGNITQIKNIIKEVSNNNGIINEEERGEAIDFDRIEELLVKKEDKYVLIDEASIISSKRNSFNIIPLKRGSESSISYTGSIENNKLDIDKNNPQISSARPNYRRNYSENNFSFNAERYIENLNDISDDDIRLIGTSNHVKQTSQLSLSQRKNELGLKIETNYNKMSGKNKKNNRLSDDFAPPSEKKNKYKDFKSATIKGNTITHDVKQPYSSRDNYLENEERYFVSLNDLEGSNEKRRSKLEKQGSGYFLTNIVEYSNSEKVVGTFLFLRFFVPAITSPENFGLTKNKISINERKSLIICGKVLTALCNNVNFGGKEKYMEYLNPFLQVHREETKEFLQWAMQFDENENNVINPVSANFIADGMEVNMIPLKPKKKDYEYDTIKSKKDKYDSEYSSENSSYSSLNMLEPNTPSGKTTYEEKNKHNKNEALFSPKKKNHTSNIGGYYEDGSHFSSMPILSLDSNSSMEQLASKEKISKSKEALSNSKGSVFHNKNLKIGSMRVKHVVTDMDSTRSNIKNINPTEIKKDYDNEIKDIINFLSKNVHLLEKEIESKTNVLPLDECEGVYSGFLELKQLIFLSEDNNGMKSWFKKIF